MLDATIPEQWGLWGLGAKLHHKGAIGWERGYRLGYTWTPCGHIDRYVIILPSACSGHHVRLQTKQGELLQAKSNMIKTPSFLFRSYPEAECMTGFVP
jgi:hypothetical protein